MIALDTNILARYYVRHQDANGERQRSAVTERISQQPALYVPKTVLLELEWVLRGVYGYGAAQIHRAFAHLIALANIVVENREEVEAAIRAHQRGVDFADALHQASAKQCTAFATLDRIFARRSLRLGLKPRVSVVAR
jgi:predicted nucleic-acid-binding protein